MSRVNNVVEQRTTIIAATIRVLTRDGLTETTTRKIAAEANVNQATLRYYFGSMVSFYSLLASQILLVPTKILIISS